MSFGPPPAGFGPPPEAEGERGAGSPAAPVGSPPAAQQPSVPPSAPGWVAPTDVEQALYDAKVRGDWDAYFATLGRELLYFEVVREKAEDGGIYPVFTRLPRTKESWWPVYTAGMLPAPGPDQVFHSETLRWLARTWRKSDPPFLVVNPGSPCEAYLPAAPPQSDAWARHQSEVPLLDLPRRLRTLRVGGPLHGPVAHGLACSAQLSVKNRLIWNAMAWHGTGYIDERRMLKEWWGIHDREEWAETLRRLQEADMVSPVWEFVLGLRRSLARDFGGHVDTEYWRQAAARVLRGRASEVVITPDGVTSDPRPESEVEAQIVGVQRLIGRITRYEARFRADGLLEGDQFVRSADAWDLGRASAMALWGLGARYCTLEEAERHVITAGRHCAREYHSWKDLSVGFALGRCLHFDEEEFGSWYEEMREAHHILTSDPGSPWLNIPFR
ncbi:DUF1266 domain-containing protein [Streptomyces sp. ODS28]|uniref:DUF1266 domain-containing protein n=1 Tax=Streptomyces sp. ODS28 TaxID=3136688 RepID=UPI0031F113BC